MSPGQTTERPLGLTFLALKQWMPQGTTIGPGIFTLLFGCAVHSEGSVLFSLGFQAGGRGFVCRGSGFGERRDGPRVGGFRIRSRSREIKALSRIIKANLKLNGCSDGV